MGGKGASQPQSEFQTGFDQWKAGQSGAGQEPSGEQGGAAAFGQAGGGSSSSTQNPDAAKNALIGAGIGGMLLGPIGTLVGGALGYFGGDDNKTEGGAGEFESLENAPFSTPGQDRTYTSGNEDYSSLLGGDDDDTGTYDEFAGR